MTGSSAPPVSHSPLGIASFLLSFFPILFLVGIYQLVLYVLRREPPGTDETGYAFWMFLLLLLTLSSEFVALGLGVAGTFQRRRKRLFAFLGVACAVASFVFIQATVGFGDMASVVVGLTEPQPKVHVVSPGNN